MYIPDQKASYHFAPEQFTTRVCSMCEYQTASHIFAAPINKELFALCPICQDRLGINETQKDDQLIYNPLQQRQSVVIVTTRPYRDDESVWHHQQW